MAHLLLKVRHLTKTFRPRGGGVVHAVNDVSFDLARGETLGIVGESGSGKTTAARCVLRAIDPTSGSALFTNAGRTVELTTLTARQLKPLRREMQMVFQDPIGSLNPRMTVAQIVGEPLLIHGIGSKREQRDKVADILRRVGLLPEHMSRYPHAFSGGQRQRIGIARALILRPALVVCDEAVSALDVSVRAAVLDLLAELQQEFGLTYLFVSHDLSVVRNVCDRVLVMYRGRIVESGPTDAMYASPQHAYTRVLLSAIPYPDPDRRMNPLKVSDLTPEQLEPHSSAVPG